MTTVGYHVDAVVDRTGRKRREICLREGREVVPEGGEPDRYVRRPGFIVPGLRDSHLHLGSISASTSGVSLAGVSGFDDIAMALSARGTGDVVAIGFDETDIDERRLPEAADLDTMISDRAVLVYRVCGHIAMANTVALERAGLSAATPDPPNGSLDRDGSGRPNGILRETAIDLVSTVIDDASRQIDTGDLQNTLRRLAGLGLTSATAMVPAGAPAWCGPDDELDQLLAIQGERELSIDAVLISNTVEDLRHHAARLDGSAVAFAGWKGFADGSLGGHTAALSAPYRDRSDATGTVRFEADGFLKMADVALELTGSVCIHAIGDAAVGSVLDLFADLTASGAPADRLRVEHASVLSPALIDQMARLGVTASIQPAFVPSDARWLDDRLGPERARWAYPFRSMLDAGVELLGGSDAPVEHPDPLAGARAAVERSGWNTEQSLEPSEALALFAHGSFADGNALWVSPALDRFERLG